MEYDISLGELNAILTRLNILAKDTSIYVRLLYELPSKDKSHLAITKEDNFILLCKYFKNYFNNIHFCGGQRKYDWKQLVTLEPHPHGVDLYSSQTWKVWDDWCPWLYATLMNNKNYKKYKDSEPKDGSYTRLPENSSGEKRIRNTSGKKPSHKKKKKGGCLSFLIKLFYILCL